MPHNSLFSHRDSFTLRQKILQINWVFVLLIILLATIGFFLQFAAAKGNMEPWAERQIIRFAMGFVLMLAVALIDIRWWLRLSYGIYFLTLILLILVELFGQIGMGAQRWINLGFIQLQPSEVMKVALVLALARYFHGLTYEETGRFHLLIMPTFLVIVPVMLVLIQPDLGTAMMLLAIGGSIFFLAGVRWWKFALVLGSLLAALPIAYSFLAEYQIERIQTFLNPESDPLGAGYHIIQSKIALGSGGLWGKGYLQGTQNYLDFVPEKQTDFIFPLFAEEFGFIGAMGLISLLTMMVFMMIMIGMFCRHQFGRLIAIGLAMNFFLYIFINLAMVMGLMPVVGVPLPLLSYGGTVMLTILFGFGLVQSVAINRELRIGRRGGTA